MSPEQIFGIGARDVGLRMNLVGMLPSAVLVVFALAAAWSGAPSDPPDLDRIGERAAELDAGEIALLTLAVLVLSLVLHPLQLSFVRLLEGYWGASKAGTLLAERLTEKHARRRTTLDGLRKLRVEPGREVTAEDRQRVGAAFWQRRMLYADGPLLPTLLGNVLRAAERRAGERYGLDAVVAWPRLYPLLSDRVQGALEDARNQLDMAVRFCLVFLLMTVAGVVFFAVHGWWLMVALGALLLAWASYRGAVGAALAYGTLIEGAFDLQRFDLVQALHLPLPPDLAHERTANAELSAFLRGQPSSPNLTYDHGEAEQACGPGRDSGPRAAVSRPPSA